MTFSHQALDLKEEWPLVFTALSKHLFYFRVQICKFVIEQKKVPLNPFMISDYFLADTVDRDLVRTANNSLVKRSDEFWVFGPVSNGVLAEIIQAKKAGKPVNYFKIIDSLRIEKVTPDQVEFEPEVADQRKLILT